MYNDIKNIIIISIIVLILDAIFLSLISDTFKNMMEKVQNKKIRNFTIQYTYVPIIYIIMILSLYILVLRDRRPIWHASLLGLAIYGTYEFTNLATISNWDLSFSILDTMWGVFCFTLSTYLYYIITYTNYYF